MTSGQRLSAFTASLLLTLSLEYVNINCTLYIKHATNKQHRHLCIYALRHTNVVNVFNYSLWNQTIRKRFTRIRSKQRQTVQSLKAKIHYTSFP